jgi:hypothetical protein
MTRILPTDISPDGVRIIVDWEKFLPGTSVFIPAVKTNAAITQLLAAARIKRNQIEVRVCVEGGKHGVRVWRLA